MDCFKVLGIEKTEDKGIIKKAYKKLLPTVHPEEDQEGFQRLRQAYEEAIAYKATAVLEDEIGLWINKVKAVYEDFEKRISIVSWQNLLEDDVCIAIDTAQEVNKRLLGFIMTNYYLPHEILNLLEDHFNWKERRRELCNIFPEEYIDYLISNAEYEDNFRYAAFGVEQGMDYDTFISNYFYLLNNIYNYEERDKEEILKKTKLMGIEHPDFTVLCMRYALMAKDFALAEELKDGALLRYENDERVMYAAAQIELILENYETAAELSKKILLIDPKHTGAKVVAADVLRGFKLYKEAIEKYKELSKELPYDNYLNEVTHDTYVELVKIYKEEIEQETNEQKKDALRMLYADAALGSYQFEEAEEMAVLIDPAAVDAYDYNLYMGRIYNGIYEHKTALGYYEKALELFTGTEDEHADLLVDRALQYERLEDYEKAMELYEEGLLLYPDSDRLNYRKAAILNQKDKPSEALVLCEKALGIKETPNAYHYKAEALYLLGEYEEALSNCDLSIERIPYYATYKIKMEILYKMHDFKTVLEIAEELKDVGIAAPELLLIEAKAFTEVERYEDAKEALGKILEEEPKNKEAYYELALVHWYEKDYEAALAKLLLTEGEVKDRKGYFYFLGNIYMRLDKLVEAEEVYVFLFENYQESREYVCICLGTLYKKRKDYVKALEFYKKVLEINPNHNFANGEIADVYELCGDYKSAFRYNTYQIEQEPSDYYYIQRGILYGNIGEREKELESYMIAYEMNPNNSFANSNIGLCYIKMGSPEKAIEYYERAIEQDFPYPDAYINIALCLSRLGREEEAYVYFDKGFEKYPDKYGILKRKGHTLQHNGSFDEAIQIFLRYAEVSGEYFDTYLNIGDSYREKGDKERALLFYKKARARDKGSEIPFLKIGCICYKERDYKKALNFYRKAFGKAKDNVSVYEYLGDAYTMLGKKKKARENFLLALNLHLKELAESIKDGEETPCDYERAANLYRKLGEMEKAKAMFEKAFAGVAAYKYCYSMRCYRGYFDLGLLYEEESDYENSLKNFKKAEELNQGRTMGNCY